MIYFDTTKAGGAKHRSGLVRVSTRLRAELGDRALGVRWPEWPRALTREDWFVTAELFSEEERPGFSAFLGSRACRTAAIFHDAIPLKFPDITWPHSVARQPGYMKLLAGFDRVWAVSQASKAELEGFWRWQGLSIVPPVAVLPLGADLPGQARVQSGHDARPPAQLLSVGILEPRKNQAFLLDACERLWAEGATFELHVVGRVNPHFGRPIAARLRRMARGGRPVWWHDSPGDAALRERYAQARVTVFPTIAEGCGLPLLESLWMGVPCVCSDLPVLRENADGGGCLPVAVNDADAWVAALRRVLGDAEFAGQLRRDARSRPLPTWAEAAALLHDGLG